MFVHVGWTAHLIEGGLYLPCADRLLRALQAEEVRGGMDLGEWLISKSSLY